MKIDSSLKTIDSPKYDKQNTEVSKQVLNERVADSSDKEKSNKPSKTEVKQAVEKLNQTARAFNKRFHFSIHEATHRVMVQVIDTATDKVINEIPPKKVLDIVGSMNQLLGLIIDEKV